MGSLFEIVLIVALGGLLIGCIGNDNVVDRGRVIACSDFQLWFSESDSIVQILWEFCHVMD
jgi:hypothetical protein